jgi:uncharacterized protein
VIVAKIKDVWSRFAGRGTYPHELAFVLLLPIRRFVLSPDELVQHLQLRPAFRVLEVGPGPGFFSVAVARSLSQGRLELVDIQREMLQKARRRLRRARVANVGYTQASAAWLPFSPATFDVVFLVAVLGEVPDPKECLHAISRTLRRGGLLSITELAGDPDALREDQLANLAQGAGFEFVGSVRIRGGFVASFRC